MLKGNKHTKKLNNKGLTLVELIITITVLALVSGFILSAFVSAMRTSAKSRDVHRATTVAQNIMEGINLKTAEEMAYQFSYPVTKDSAGANVDNFGIYPTVMFEHGASNSVGELVSWTDPATGDVSWEIVNTSRSLNDYKALTDAYDIAKTKSAYMSDITSGKYEFLKDADGRYVYYMRNIRNDGRYYNAKVTLDASAYKSGGATGLNVNNDMIISVPTIDSTYDAVEVMKDDLDSETFYQKDMDYPSENLEQEDLYRIINITINNDLMAGPTTQYRTSVKVDYLYYIRKDDNTFTTPIPGIGTNTVFDNDGNESEKQLRNIYLYYYPLYTSKYLDTVHNDIIIIDNNSNMDVDLFVIKQEPANNALTQAEMEIQEQTYGVTFKVNETTLNSEGKSHVRLFTNWNENLGTIYSGNHYSTNQVKLYRNNVQVTADMFNMNDIKNKQAQDRIYDVTVEIYQSESMDASTFAASTLPSEWFKEENHLMTITSSISQ